tara:strand:- start:1663 stop:2094 length:432 start_codon:yes stop_codon:yes gene_type:complete
MKTIVNLIINFFIFTESSFVKNNIYINIKIQKPINYHKMSLNIEEINNYKLIDKILDIKIENTKNLGRVIVEKTSSYLPKVDNIGHNVLHANNEFISSILNMDTLPDNFKKEIVLFSIRLAQYGDNLGSHMLQLYYDLVDKCL